MSILQITTEGELDLIMQTGTTLVVFGSTWSAPFKMIEPILDELGKSYDGLVHIVKVNVDQARELTMEYKIISIPTLVLFKDGELYKELKGFASKREIEELMQ